ncbi:MAG: MoxR family ATPase, partial [Myxococcota bacterium]
NPIEQEGTYPLPEAQLDRFLLKVEMGYPSAEEEAQIVAAVTRNRVGAKLDASATQPITDPVGAVALQQQAAQITVEPRVVDYAVRLARATREYPGISVGAGPRGAIALIRAARAAALLQGRDFVIPDDVKGLVAPALRHRIILAPELEIEGQRPDDALARILEIVEAPRQ